MEYIFVLWALRYIIMKCQRNLSENETLKKILLQTATATFLQLKCLMLVNCECFAQIMSFC